MDYKDAFRFRQEIGANLSKIGVKSRKRLSKKIQKSEEIKFFLGSYKSDGEKIDINLEIKVYEDIIEYNEFYLFTLYLNYKCPKPHPHSYINWDHFHEKIFPDVFEYLNKTIWDRASDLFDVKDDCIDTAYGNGGRFLSQRFEVSLKY